MDGFSALLAVARGEEALMERQASVRSVTPIPLMAAFLLSVSGSACPCGYNSCPETDDGGKQDASPLDAGLADAGTPTIEDQILAWLKQQQDPTTQLVRSQENTQANTYSNSLAVMVFTLKGDKSRASQILDFYARRLASEFYYNSDARGFFQNRDAHTGQPDSGDRWMGDNAWLAMAIHYYHSAFNDSSYDAVAQAIIALLESFQQPAGYIAKGWQNGDARFSTDGHTEGNLDAYRALTLYNAPAKVTGPVKHWLDYADLNWRKGPLDIHTWRVLALGADYGFCLPELERTDLAEARLKWTVTVGSQTVTGFMPSVGLPANIWSEGTGGAAVAFYRAGYTGLGDFYVGELEKLIFDSTSFPGTKTIAFIARPDSVNYSWVDTTQGFAPGVCWYILAKNKFDPFAGELISPAQPQNPLVRPQAVNYESHDGFLRFDGNGAILEGKAIHLAGDGTTGDNSGWVDYKFNLLSPISNASVRIRYADDIKGAPAGDIVTILVDGTKVSTFNTSQFSSGGWDDYVWSSGFSVGPLAAGIHTLRLQATDNHTYGFTVDCSEIYQYAPKILAELQVWHGLSSGHVDPPYDSRDPAVIARQIDQAIAEGISGFVINWYGPADGALNDKERKFQDDATAALFVQAEVKGFKLALIYDEGAIDPGEGETHTERFQARMISDLDYARKYYSSKAYLNINDCPALFVFPYSSVEPYIKWSAVRQTFVSPVTLIDKDPDPLDTSDHDAQFDGFYAWVTATNGAWDIEGKERGEAYMNWFYPTMRGTSYSDKVMVGGVWPGFDDTLAPWHKSEAIRYMARRGTETYERSMALARQNEAPYIMIETWNDFEEGTDVEFGISIAVDMDRDDVGSDAGNARMIRSSPLQVIWRQDHPNPGLQIYKSGLLLPTQTDESGKYINLKSGSTYELKLWAGDLPQPLSRWVTIRHRDPVPGVTPVDVDP